MRTIVSIGAAAALLAVVGAALARPTTTVTTLKATMTPGAEVPKPSSAAGATGLFTATVTESGGARTMRWKLTFGGLSGKAVAAHIHKGKPGVAGGVLVGLCGPCPTGRSGQARISSSIAAALERGGAYVNVHTARNGAGEVRGQVKLVKRSGAPAAEPGPVTTTPDDGGGGYGY